MITGYINTNIWTAFCNWKDFSNEHIRARKYNKETATCEQHILNVVTWPV
jgi:hypothetical protein